MLGGRRWRKRLVASSFARRALLASLLVPLVSLATLTFVSGAQLGWLADTLSVVTVLFTVVLGLLGATRSGDLSAKELAEAANRLNQRVLRNEADQRFHLLGDKATPADLRFERLMVRFRAAGGEQSGTLTAITEYFTGLAPGRLVILGEPGAGKTVLALELLVRLAERRQPDSDDPVPVRFALTDWDARSSLAAWMIDSLVSEQRLPHAAAGALVENGLVLPVLDGLDEMDPDRAREAVERMNAYLKGATLGPLVVTCRADEYRALASAAGGVVDATGVIVQPLAAQEIRRVLAGRFGTARDAAAWRPVLRALDRPRGRAARFLSTPWRMTLAVLSYQAGLLDPQILTGPRERVEQELVRHFVEASNTVYGQLQERRYRTADVQRWLTGLADHLNHAAATTRTQAATEIHLAGLWRVAGGRRSRLLHAAANVVAIGAAWAASVQVALGFDRMGVFFRHVGERPPPNAAESAGLLAILVVWTALGLRQGLTRECAPRRASITQIAVPRNALRGLYFGVIGGVLTGVTGGAWLGPGLGFAVGAGTLAGIALVAGAFGGITDDVDPLGPLRTDLLFGLASGLIIGAGLTGAGVVSLAFGIDLDSLADTRGLSGVLIGTMLSGLMVGLTLVSAASIRYAVAVVILALNRRMPWRPGRFFVWAQRTGILRFAGVAMQFRHLELQRLLAAAKSTRA